MVHSKVETQQEPVPVTIVAGFLGSGKTTLLNWILRAPHGQKLAVIVNEFGRVGIDGALIQGGEQFVELDNGCLCCALNADLDRTVRALVARGGFDRIVVETTGLADPLPVAWSFMRDGLQRALRVDAIVVLVDAACVHRAVAEAAEVRTQLRRADLVVLNKLDLVQDDGAAARSLIRKINAEAPILPAVRAQAPVALLLDVHRIDAQWGDLARQQGGGLEAAALRHHTDFQTYTWTAPPGAVIDERRLEAFVYEVPPCIYRFKGLVRTNSDWGPWTLVNAVAGRVDLRPIVPRKFRSASSIVFIGQSCEGPDLETLCAPLLVAQ